MFRRRIIIRGVVQGVGFRPHVARVAAVIGVSGFCGNDDESVFVEAQGSMCQLDAFVSRVVDEAPPLAHIVDISFAECDPILEEFGFAIVESQHDESGVLTLVPPDVARCADCLHEMRDSNDRRFNYPFISCTNCGPRLSIITDVPYDRAKTSLEKFPMCSACESEYTNPKNRRFHAEPVSCFDCGPRLWLVEGDDALREWGVAIERSRTIIASGGIVAVKGMGGFTLMCDARNESAVARLRERKHRPAKPFAVMAADLQTASSFATFSPAQVTAVTSPARSIVLAPMSSDYDLAESVAPGLADVGVMLPSAPVHDLLLRPGDVFVATSGNISGDPLCYRNADALRDLAPLVEAILVNDRDIVVPVEDSVMMADDDGLMPIRRSRGFAPLPVNLSTTATILAVGGELKNTFALTRDGYAFVSAHIGDMGSLATQAAFDRSVAQMLTAHRTAPDLIVSDLHPGYSTTAWAQRYAERHDIPLVQVQHHTAHALSLIAEHDLLDSREPILVLAFDGTGYGEDGTIWGGELLLIQAGDAQRVWHLPAFGLPGGDSAVTNPWKAALGLLHACGIERVDLPPHEFAPRAERDLVHSQLVSGMAVVPSTSAGRLFDAFASLVGVRHRVSFEAQAAMELEACARACAHPSQTSVTVNANIDVRGLVDEVISGLDDGLAMCCLARRIHEGMARIAAEAVRRASESFEGEVTVGLTGGVFQNRLLLHGVREALHQSPQIGRVLVHHRVPANDGGLSLGQAAFGALLLGQKGDTSCV